MTQLFDLSMLLHDPYGFPVTTCPVFRNQVIRRPERVSFVVPSSSLVLNLLARVYYQQRPHALHFFRYPRPRHPSLFMTTPPPCSWLLTCRRTPKNKDWSNDSMPPLHHVIPPAEISTAASLRPCRSESGKGQDALDNSTHKGISRNETRREFDRCVIHFMYMVQVGFTLLWF